MHYNSNEINYPLILDGGLSNELEKGGCNLNHKLWSANVIINDPDAIIKAHLSYLKAGADCIITSSYQASVSGFMSIGYDQQESEDFLLQTVNLAEQAIKTFLSTENKSIKPLIAASIGPYGAILADGSEYSGDYKISDDELMAFHLPRIKILEKSNADFFACETIPSFQEAKVLGEILKNTKKKAWLSFSCKDEVHINDGTPISECISYFSQYQNIFALGVNCTAPKYISGLIKLIKPVIGDKKIIVYPNSGEVYLAESKSWKDSSDPVNFASMVEEWINLGVDLIGGCCRIGPEHIAGISKIIRNEL